MWFLKTYWPNSFPQLLFLIVTLYRALETHLFDTKRRFCHSQVITPRTRESKTVLDSGFHAVDFGFQLLNSGFCKWNLNSGFQSLVGSATREAGFAQILARDRDDRCAGCLEKGAGMRDQLSPTSLRESSQGLSGGGTGKGRTACKFELHLQFPCGSPPTELSDFRQSARSKNERECKQTLKKKYQG